MFLCAHLMAGCLSKVAVGDENDTNDATQDLLSDISLTMHLFMRLFAGVEILKRIGFSRLRL